ncbi:MAG: RluA family pseudouridine synthase [Rickettsiales bacterium]|jgi:23S rRNA pseudouridine955/2504/2580 synthase|nr:RluA family pseudouridine synthase [Rickettsiales bacterium]
MTTMPIEPIKISPTEDGIRLNRWFGRHYPAVAPAEFHKLCRTGQIRVNAGRVRGREVLYTGDLVRIPPSVANRAVAVQSGPKKNDGSGFSMADLEQLRRAIIYNDDDIAVFNKPAGLAVQGGTGISKSLDKMIVALFPNDRPMIVHRLDRETSGVIVIAKNQIAAQNLSAQFADNTVAKEYIALLHGRVNPKSGKIDNFIAADNKVKPQRAITKYRALGGLGHILTWVAFAPETGRTHQLRIHSATFLHAPIVGDAIYGDNAKIEDPTLSAIITTKNLFLFARRITIRHPVTGKTLTFTAEMPEFMKSVAEFLELRLP